MIQLDRILVPTDFSEGSKTALQYACGLAEKLDAQLHLLHVIPDHAWLIAGSDALYSIPGDYYQEVHEEVRRELSRLVDSTAEAKARITSDFRDGAPFVEIVRCARQQSVDLIVIGTHGRTGLPHLMIGSVAEKVVRKAPCPVLTVRPADFEFIMP